MLIVARSKYWINFSNKRYANLNSTAGPVVACSVSVWLPRVGLQIKIFFHEAQITARDSIKISYHTCAIYILDIADISKTPVTSPYPFSFPYL